MSAIEVEGLTLEAGDFRLQELGFQVEEGEYAVLMGATGSGKTTLLEAICGLLSPLAGTIAIASEDVTARRPADRGIGYVPQDGALFQNLTVAQHLAFGPRFRGWESEEIGLRVEELAGLLGIGALLERRPRGLSGGERQRVALGRALAARPTVLLLDEPLSAVDEETREGLFELLLDLRESAGVTTLHVTHSSSEAQRLATLRLRLASGRVLVDGPNR